MKHMLTEEEKIFIIQNYDKMTLGRIGQLLNVNRYTVFYFFKRWTERKTIINKKLIGSVSKLGNSTYK